MRFLRNADRFRDEVARTAIHQVATRQHQPANHPMNQPLQQPPNRGVRACGQLANQLHPRPRKSVLRCKDEKRWDQSTTSQLCFFVVLGHWLSTTVGVGVGFVVVASAVMAVVPAVVVIVVGVVLVVVMFLLLLL